MMQNNFKDQDQEVEFTSICLMSVSLVIKYLRLNFQNHNWKS